MAVPSLHDTDRRPQGWAPLSSDYELKPIALPGATGAVALDYFAYDRATGKFWVPASNTGSVDLNLMTLIAALLWGRT